MKKILIVTLGLILYDVVNAQQISHSTPIQELQHIWNPAFTAPGTKLDASVYFRKQWVGFEGSPTTAVASVQYPFADYNMSVGGLLISDRTGPISKNGIQLNYAYKLKELINRDDQLVLAANGFFHQFSLDASSLVVRDVDDVLLTSNRQTKFIPAFGFGFAYFSNTEEYNGDNAFYFGISALQILESDLLLDAGNAARARHFYVNMGTKLYGYDHYIEPSFQVNFVRPDIITYQLGAKFELEEAFWAGVFYSSVNDVSINGGVILDEIAGRYTQLKIGALATINGGSLLTAGTSFELFVSYTLDVD